MASILIVWLLLLNYATAHPWRGPMETLSATATADWSPAPTPMEAVQAGELLKRGLYPANLCGWQGPEYQGAYCGSDSYCAWFTDYSVVGCCQSTGYCDAVYTSCIDGNAPAQSVSYPGVLTCTSTSVCYQNTYPSSYYQYGCYTTSTGEDVVTSWTGINTQFSIAITYGGAVLATEAPVTLISSAAASSTIAIASSTIATASSTIATASSTIATASSTIAGNPIVLSSLKTQTGYPVSATSSSQSTDQPTTTVNGGALTTISATPSLTVQPSSSSGLSTGAKAGIGVGVAIAAIAALLLLGYFVWRHGKKLGAIGAAGNNRTDPAERELETTAAVPDNKPVVTYQDYDLHKKTAESGSQNRPASSAFSDQPSMQTTAIPNSPMAPSELSVGARSSTRTGQHMPQIYEMSSGGVRGPTVPTDNMHELESDRDAGILALHTAASPYVASNPSHELP